MTSKSKLLIAGVDEVGIGPLAGPVVAAAVILNPNKRIPGIRDSKKLTEKQRERLFEKIYEKAFAVSIGRAEVEEIDTLNIYHATMLALQRAVMGLPMVPDQVLIDGRAKPNLFFDTVTIVDGDESRREIGAASIIAKVTRDREMVALDKIYPQYQFAKHKGYSTKLHKSLLAEYGPCAIHRKSFGPCNIMGSDPQGKYGV